MINENIAVENLIKATKNLVLYDLMGQAQIPKYNVDGHFAELKSNQSIVFNKNIKDLMLETINIDPFDNNQLLNLEKLFVKTICIANFNDILQDSYLNNKDICYMKILANPSDNDKFADCKNLSLSEFIEPGTIFSFPGPEYTGVMSLRSIDENDQLTYDVGLAIRSDMIIKYQL